MQAASDLQTLRLGVVCLVLLSPRSFVGLVTKGGEYRWKIQRLHLRMCVNCSLNNPPVNEHMEEKFVFSLGFMRDPKQPERPFREKSRALHTTNRRKKKKKFPFQRISVQLFDSARKTLLRPVKRSNTSLRI